MLQATTNTKPTATTFAGTSPPAPDPSASPGAAPVASPPIQRQPASPPTAPPPAGSWGGATTKSSDLAGKVASGFRAVGSSSWDLVRSKYLAPLLAVGLTFALVYGARAALGIANIESYLRDLVKDINDTVDTVYRVSWDIAVPLFSDEAQLAIELGLRQPDRPPDERNDQWLQYIIDPTTEPDLSVIIANWHQQNALTHISPSIATILAIPTDVAATFTIGQISPLQLGIIERRLTSVPNILQSIGRRRIEFQTSSDSRVTGNYELHCFGRDDVASPTGLALQVYIEDDDATTHPFTNEPFSSTPKGRISIDPRITASDTGTNTMRRYLDLSVFGALSAITAEHEAVISRVLDSQLIRCEFSAFIIVSDQVPEFHESSLVGWLRNALSSIGGR